MPCLDAVGLDCNEAKRCVRVSGNSNRKWDIGGAVTFVLKPWFLAVLV